MEVVRALRLGLKMILIKLKASSERLTAVLVEELEICRHELNSVFKQANLFVILYWSYQSVSIYFLAFV